MTALARIDLSGRRSPLASAPMRWFGELSFAFYLVHLLVLQRLPTVLPVDPEAARRCCTRCSPSWSRRRSPQGSTTEWSSPPGQCSSGDTSAGQRRTGGRRSVRNRVALIPVVRWKNRLKFVASVNPRRSAIRATGRSVYPSRRCASSAIRRSISCFGLVPFLGHGAGDRPDAVPEDLCVLGDGVQLGEPPLHLPAEPGRERVLHPVVGGRCRAALEQDEDRTEQQLQHHPGRDLAVVLARELAGDRTDRGGGFRVRDGHRLAHADPVGGRQARQELVGDEQVESVEVAVLEPLHLPRSHPQHPVTIEREVLEVDLSPAGALGDDREDVEVDPVLPSVGAEAHATPQVADPDDLDARHDGRPERQLLHLPHTDHLSRIDPNESTSALDAGTGEESIDRGREQQAAGEKES